MTNKEIVLVFYEKVFNAHDLTDLDAYMCPNYKQHSEVADGRDGFRAMAEKFFTLKPHMDIVHCVVEGDMVVVYFKCTLADGTVNKVFDMYRIENGLLTEHWDCVAHGIDMEAVKELNGNGPF